MPDMIEGVAQNPEALAQYAALEAGQEVLLDVWQRANQAGWMTLTGLDPDALYAENDALLSDEDEDRIVLFVAGMGDSAAWARGDFCAYVRRKIRDRASEGGWTVQAYNETWGKELDRLSRRFGVSPKTLMNNITTTLAWPHEQRVAGQHVRYKHHEALPNDMSVKDRHHWLYVAEEEGWTWARLYKVVRGQLAPDGTAITQEEPRTFFLGDGKLTVDEMIERNDKQEMDEWKLLDKQAALEAVDDLIAEALPDADADAVDDANPFPTVYDDAINALTALGDALGIDAAAPELQGDAVVIPAFDADNLPEGWQAYEPMAISDAVIPWTAQDHDENDTEWASFSLVDHMGNVTILNEGARDPQFIHVLFGNGTSWQVAIRPQLANIQVRMIRNGEEAPA